MQVICSDKSDLLFGPSEAEAAEPTVSGLGPAAATVQPMAMPSMPCSVPTPRAASAARHQAHKSEAERLEAEESALRESLGDLEDSAREALGRLSQVGIKESVLEASSLSDQASSLNTGTGLSLSPNNEEMLLRCTRPEPRAAFVAFY